MDRQSSRPRPRESRGASRACRQGREGSSKKATGLHCSGWTVRDMHTRWGSCNTTTRHINLSLMLATRSDAELDYVILHELAHTVVPNHGADFYALMDRYMPGWKKIRKALNY